MLEHGTLPFSWAGPPPSEPAPTFAVHHYNPGLVILRQSGRTHFEKPFLYLVLGDERALLVDTGAPGVDVAGAVQGILAGLAGERRELIVVHTHAHSDHVAGDAQFRGLPSTRVVGADLDAVSAFFRIDGWPDGAGLVDLGGRTLDVIPIPGHDTTSIALYDRRTGVLLSGDLLYPGRLYVRDAAPFRASVGRLVAFTETRPVAHILGAHIENARTPFTDYPEGTAWQPDEHALELGRAHLLELENALAAMAPGIERRALRDFTVWPVS